jgi:hypothetical protein
MLLLMAGLVVVVSSVVGNDHDLQVNTSPTLNATTLMATIYTLVGVDPLHTPRPLRILPTETPVPTSTRLALTGTPSPVFQPGITPRPQFSIWLREDQIIPEHMCIVLNPHEFEIEDEYFDAFGLIHNTRVVIDDEIILTWRDFRYFDYAENIVFDEEGNLVGSREFPVEFCIDTHNLAVGQHVAVITTTTPTHITYTYSWRFEIEEPSFDRSSQP